MKKLALFTSCLLIAISFSSCGVALIQTDPKNDIYINGIKKGTEQVEIKRNGIPGKRQVEIKKGNKVVNSVYIKRKITIKSFLFGWPGLFFCWQFPKKTYLKGRKKSEENIWSLPPQNLSIWDTKK